MSRRATENVSARISFNVTTRDADTARDAASRFVHTIDRVWIVDEPADVAPVADGVYSVRVRVIAPNHELHDRAPITRDALNAAAHAAPADSLRFILRGVTR